MIDADNRGWTNGGWFDSTPDVDDKYENYDADGKWYASIITRWLHVHVTFEERCLHN